MERKWTERKYHVQDNASVELKDVKMYCNKNQFPALPFCGPHSKPHGARGIGKHYHLRFDPKLGMGECAICRIPYIHSLSSIDVQATHSHGIRRIVHLPNSLFIGDRKRL